MRNFTRSLHKYFFTGLTMCASFAAVAQIVPGSVGTDLANGIYVNVATTNYGLFNQYRVQATVSAASGTRKLEFPEFVGAGGYFNVWRTYTGGTLSGYNTMIDPSSQAGSAKWNSNYGGTAISMPAVTSGNYYTVNIMTNNAYNNDTMAVLETSYSPITILSVSIPIDTNTVGPACSPIINTTLSNAPSVGEYVYLRYSTTGFRDSSVVIPMSVSGTTASAQIPAYPSGTHIDYYILTSPVASLIATGPGSGYYDCLTLNLKNGSIGNNFRYTVKNLPVPSVSISALLNPVCSRSNDIFTAHGINNGTVASDYQWYKNGVAVGTNDSIYTDALLANHDSIWVVMKANLGCPVYDTSNHIVMTVNPNPNISAHDTAVCPGNSVDLSTLVIGASNPLIYRQDSIAGPTLTNPITIAASHAYIILDSNATTGCFDTAKATVSLNPTVSPSVLATTSHLSYCGSIGTDTFIAIPTLGGTAPTYQWIINEIPVATGDTFISNSFNAGDNIAVIMTNNIACADQPSIQSNVINVSLNQPSLYTQSPVLCYGQSLSVGIHDYNSNGSYSDTLMGSSVTGCDSIINTILTIRPKDSIEQNVTICYGGSMRVGTAVHSATGIYTDTLIAADRNGCDSIVTTNLTIRPKDSIGQAVTVCYGGSVMVGTSMHNIAGIYTDTLLAADRNGCDSIVTTTLSIRQKDSIGQNITVCYGGSVAVGSHIHSATGIYTDTLFAADYNGCDSIVTTNLTIIQKDSVFQTKNICQGGSVTVGSSIHNVSGFYTDTLFAADRNGCDSIVTTHLIVHPLPVISLGPNVTQCGGNVKINAGNAGSTFLWSNGIRSQIDTVSTSGTYYVVVTSPFGCVSSDSITVYIKSSPVVDLGPSQTLCGDSVILDAGNPGDTYSWTGGSAGQFLIVKTTGTYTVTVTDTASSCVSTASVLININTPTSVALGNDTSICGGSLILNTKILNSRYIWSNGDTTATITVSSTGNYGVTVIEPTGCSATGSIFVNVYTKPNLGADVTDSVCRYSRANLYNYYLNSGLTLAYINTSTPASVDTGTYTVIGTTTNGCKDTALITIVYRQSPNVGGNKTDSICIGYKYNLTTLYPNTGYTNYIWNTANPTAVDTGSYMLVVTGANGCTDTAMATITLRSKPNLGGNKTDSVCRGYTYNLNILYPNIGYTTYAWTGVANDSAVSVGTYQLIVSNASGCTDTAYATITQRAQPVVIIPDFADLCSTNPPFALTGASPIGGTYYVDYVVDSIFRTPTLGSGVHHVLYIYTNTSGCTDSASHNVTIFPKPQIIDTIGLPTVCTGSTLINLNNYFSPSGGQFIGVGVSGYYFYPSLALVGSDSITYIYTDKNGCMDTAGRRIDIIPSVHVTLHTDQSNLTICSGQSITFTAIGAHDYQFFVNDSAWTSLDTTSTFTTTALANHDQVKVVGTNGCSSDTSDFIIIDVIAPPTVTAGPDTTIDLGQTVQLYSNANGASALVYIWTPDSFLNVANIPNPVFSGSDTTTYQLRVTDTYGCSATASITINVNLPDNVLLPNVITPNGDGKNDLWILNPKINLIGSHLVIFNRWGELVYEKDNYNNDWAGTYKSTGQKVPDGTYYYVLTVPTQHNHTYKGPINVLDSEGN